MAERKKISTRRDLENAVVERALIDESYRNQLRDNPRSAVEQLLAELAPGANLQKDLEVRALFEPQTVFNIVIPHAEPAAELSDADLEQVAGGAADDRVGTFVGG